MSILTRVLRAAFLRPHLWKGSPVRRRKSLRLPIEAQTSAVRLRDLGLLDGRGLSLRRPERR